MATNFFTSPKDLAEWIKIQQSPDAAISKIVTIIGNTDEQSISEGCKSIHGNLENSNYAANVLYEVLAKHRLALTREGNMTKKITKEAQIMRQPGQYDMPLRVCPKLPFSVGKRLISTYNCRHYCVDSLVFDDDPERVYCAEALWRAHVMDKFSSDFKDENGKPVGGFINERFQVFHDDGGNPLELPHGDRTRQPRPSSWSVERRLEEARGNKTSNVIASTNKVVKLSSKMLGKDDVGDIKSVFSDVLEMREDGISDSDILEMVSDRYAMSIPDVARVLKVAIKTAKRHNGELYTVSSNGMNPSQPSANVDLISHSDVNVVLQDGTKTVLQSGTVVRPVDDSRMVIVDSGVEFQLADPAQSRDVFTDYVKDMQETGDEIGLTEDLNGSPEEM